MFFRAYNAFRNVNGKEEREAWKRMISLLEVVFADGVHLESAPYSGSGHDANDTGLRAPDTAWERIELALNKMDSQLETRRDGDGDSDADWSSDAGIEEIIAVGPRDKQAVSLENTTNP